MGPHGFLHIAAGLAGAAASGAALFGLGAPALAVGGAAFIGGVAGASSLAALAAARGVRASEARFDTLAGEMVLLRQRQADGETKLQELQQRNGESPALVWRAATADIQVLGSLVTDLARTVSEHDERLAAAETAIRPPPADAEQGFVLPQTSPPPASWFEDEAELGFTADARPAPPVEAAPPAPASAAPMRLSPAMLTELRSTLAAALLSERLELCLQPFVMLPQRKVAGYEAQLRLKGDDNHLQEAEDLRAAARAADMEGDLDRILIERAGQVLRVLRARDRVVAITCSVSGESLTDAAFRSAVEAVARGEGKLAQNIMLSIPAGDVAALRSGAAEAIASLRRTGIALGVRASAAGGVDAAALGAVGVTEVRMDAAILAGAVEGDAQGDIHPADIGELLDRRGIRLLVTGVTDEAAVRDLLDLSATLAQGELFGPSRPVRPEVLQPRPVREPTAGERMDGAKAQDRLSQDRQAQDRQSQDRSGQDRPNQPRRQSFRSLLRRA